MPEDPSFDTDHIEMGRYINAATYASLVNRLNERTSLEWASKLRDAQVSERAAVRELVWRSAIKEPYNSGWSLLLESWATKPESNDLAKYRLAAWVAQSGMSGSAMRQIVDLVRPWLKIEPLRDWSLLGGRAPPKTPRKLRDILSVTISSGSLLTLEDVGCGNIADARLLNELVDKLKAALIDGLHVATRLGWIEKKTDRVLWDVHRVYFVSGLTDQVQEREDADPDRYRTGFAPVTKLLHQTVTNLAAADPESARSQIAPWRRSTWGLFRRLWAACARDPTLASASEVHEFLIDQDGRSFWDTFAFPEFAEVRARRFADLEPKQRDQVERRIRKLSPLSMWSRRAPPEKRNEHRRRSGVVELLRIRAAGAILSDDSLHWLDENRSLQPNNIALDYGFPEGVKASWVGPDQHRAFVPSSTDNLLEELESALKAGDWDGPSSGALEYMKDNSHLVFDAIETSTNIRSGVGNVWQNIGRVFRPNPDASEKERKARNREVAKLIELADGLPEHTISFAANGLADWLSDWANESSSHRHVAHLWLRLWPHAEKTTNALQSAEAGQQKDALLGESEENSGERLAFAALNTPVGHLMTAFLNLCPNLGKKPHPFQRGHLRQMRNTAMGATGQARMQVLYRLLSHIEYMRRADEKWTDKNLLGPLRKPGPSEVEIWDAVARNPVLSAESMKQIGVQMADTARGDALPESTRAHLAERVVLRVLLDHSAKRPPSVAIATVQQMLRLGGDRVRAAAARALGVFIESGDGVTPETQFSDVARPFLENVWPKERTIRSKSLADALADLPSKCGEMFAACISAIEPLMIPFDCWSLWDFGLYGRDVDGKNLRPLRSSEDAAALLALLDVSIGTDERATVPHDLDRALAQIRDANPKLEKDIRYSRLSALVRGG